MRPILRDSSLDKSLRYYSQAAAAYGITLIQIWNGPVIIDVAERATAWNVLKGQDHTRSLAMFEQREIGYQNYGCELPPIDFVAFAKAGSAEGFHCESPEEVRPAIQAALSRTRLDRGGGRSRGEAHEAQ